MGDKCKNKQLAAKRHKEHKAEGRRHKANGDNEKNHSKSSGNGKAQREMQNVRLQREGEREGQEIRNGDWRWHWASFSESGPWPGLGLGSVSYVHGKCCKYVLKYAFIHTNMANGSGNRNSSRRNNKTSQQASAAMIDLGIPWKIQAVIAMTVYIL